MHSVFKIYYAGLKHNSSYLGLVLSSGRRQSLIGCAWTLQWSMRKSPKNLVSNSICDFCCSTLKLAGQMKEVRLERVDIWTQGCKHLFPVEKLKQYNKLFFNVLALASVFNYDCKWCHNLECHLLMTLEVSFMIVKCL